MFANLMVLWAQTFVIISDEIQINKYTSLTFRTSNDRLKYSLLVYYVDKLRLQTYFYDVMKISHQNVISHSRKSSVLEIKLLFATAIINHFCLGDFHIELLDLAPYFTEDVFGHLDVFCSSDRQMVLDSLWRSFERFTYQDYIRERSCLYLSNLYTEYCYEILKYQMDNTLWSWRHIASFKRVLGRHVSCVSLYLSFALKKTEHNYVNYNISAYDVISKRLTYTNGMDFILSLNDASVKVLILYSYDEIALATKKYEHNCIKGIQKSSLITPSYATRFNNLWSTRMVLKRLIIDYGISKHCMICRNTFHDLFYNTEKDVWDMYTLEDWIEDALAYLDNLDAAQKFFLDWYNKK